MVVSEYHRKNLNFKTPIDCLPGCLFFSLTGSQQDHKTKHLANDDTLERTNKTLLSLDGKKTQDSLTFFFNSIIDYKNFHKCDIIESCGLSKFLLNEIEIFTMLHSYIGVSKLEHVNGYNMLIKKGESKYMSFLPRFLFKIVQLRLIVHF